MKRGSDILRIGRAPSPAERGLRLALEDYDFALTIGRNLYSAAADMPLREAWVTWESMSEEDRQPWIELVIAEYRIDVEVEADPDPEPFNPDPGEGEPVSEEVYHARLTA